MRGLFFDSGIDKGFEKDLARMNRKMNTFAKTTERKGKVINTTFATIGKTLGGVGLAVGFALATKQLVTFSKDVETALTEVGTISQAVTDNFEEYKKSIIDLSTKGGQGAKKLTDAYYDIVSAGNDGVKGLKILEAAQEASTAGFVEVATAADGLTTVLNAWNKSADEAGAVSDIFFKTVEKGKTTFPELGQNISQVAPLAASLGVSFEEVSAAVATITKQGVPTAQAFTQIRSALVGMNETLGDGWAETMTLQEGFQEISDRAGGSATEIQKLVGRVEGMSAILASTGKNAAIAAEDLDAMRNSLGATGTAADKVLLSSDQKTQLFKNNLLATFSTLGDGVQQAIGNIAGDLNKLFNRQRLKAIEDQRKEFTYLVTSLNDSTKSESDRLAILEKLKLIAPDIEDSITKEGDAYVITTERLAEYNQQFINRLVLAKKQIEIDKFRTQAAEQGKRAEEALVQIQTRRAQAIFTLTEKNKKDGELARELLDGTIKKETTLSELRKKYGEETALLLNQAGINTARNQQDFVSAQNIALKAIARRNDLTADQIGLDEEFYSLIRKYNPLYQAQNASQIVANKLQEEANKLAKALGVELDKNEKKKTVIPEEKDKKLTPEEILKKELKDLEIRNQKERNLITANYGLLESDEKEHQNRLLDQQIIYLNAKYKLTTDALEKERIEAALIQAQIERELGGRVDEEDKQAENADDVKKKKLEFSDISSEFAGAGDDLASQLLTLTDSIGDVFKAFEQNADSSADKISGIVSLISELGNMLKEAMENYYSDEVDAMDRANAAISSRISGEAALNRLLRERQEIQLNQSAFLGANYIDAYQLALKTMTDSEGTISQTLSRLAKGITLTAEGAGESWNGLNKVTEEYSFTLAQITKGWDEANNVYAGGVAVSILDPLDLFGAGASADAQLDAFDKVSKGVKNALSSMGKTSAEMAKFSSEEWSDFYAILDEGGYIVDAGSKQLVSTLRESQEEYQAALEEMKGIISEIAGSLGDALGDSIVNAVATGSDALQEFEKSLNSVFIQMAKAQMNQLFFKDMFDQLQKEMGESMEGGDQDWQDDLLRFYAKLPAAIEGSTAFMEDFDQQLKDLGFSGLSGETDADQRQSTAGQIRQAITEETGTILAGHIGAVRLSNERIAIYSEEMADIALQNLVTLNAIKVNTDYLPMIAANTKKTYKALGGV